MDLDFTGNRYSTVMPQVFQVWMLLTHLYASDLALGLVREVVCIIFVYHNFRLLDLKPFGGFA